MLGSPARVVKRVLGAEVLDYVVVTDSTLAASMLS